ncbi:MAG: heavy-metal-associated domain-containing protein [Chromatiales bacterium]|nr:heavy-metal-associated domain-containing protein [Chromatiales bacterium]
MSKTYRVEGMSCGGCAASVESAIKAQVPTANVAVNLETGAVAVTGVDDDSLVQRAVESAGFTFAGPMAS